MVFKTVIRPINAFSVSLSIFEPLHGNDSNSQFDADQLCIKQGTRHTIWTSGFRRTKYVTQPYLPKAKSFRFVDRFDGNIDC